MENSVSQPQKQIRKLYKKRGYYFLLALVLLMCIVQFVYGSLYNITRYVVLNKKLNKLEELNREALSKNQQLKTQLKVYSSHKGIEELARNNLKLVGEDEVLVLIKKKKS